MKGDELTRNSGAEDSELSQDALHEFLRQNREQIEVKKQELDLQKQTDRNQFEYAKLALEAQAQDLKHQREHESNLSRSRFWFIGSCLVVIILFISYTVYAGKEEFAADMVKLLIGFITGGTSGYFYGKSKILEGRQASSDPTS